MLNRVNLSRFDLVSLRLFVAVIDGGSLTAGAELHGISLAAASKRIAELEAHVGCALLLRAKRGVTPTAAGLTLHQHAVEVVARLEQLAMAMDDFRYGAHGHLRLWANTSAFSGFLPGLLAAYAKLCPAVRIDLEDTSSEEAVRAVTTGAAELAVIGENTAVGQLETLVCDRDELVLVLPHGHPLAGAGAAQAALTDTLEHDFVTLGRGTSLTRHLAAAAETAGCRLKVRVQVRSFDAMCRMVAAGLGIAVLPRAGAAPHLVAMGLQCLALTGMSTSRRLLLAMRSRQALSPAARALIELALERAARGPASIPSPLTTTIGVLTAPPAVGSTQQGRILNLRDTYGFIQPDAGGDNIFFPFSSLGLGEAQRLQIGMRVSYEYSCGEGGPIAPKVWILPGQILPT